jgi:hypothetical protein
MARPCLGEDSFRTYGQEQDLFARLSFSCAMTEIIWMIRSLCKMLQNNVHPLPIGSRIDKLQMPHVCMGACG